ncbi:MAG: hypothetical protein IT380_24025 [Myxococcales bacterium]|nr:hypothetical protein [Myxococcales bacterium]
MKALLWAVLVALDGGAPAPPPPPVKAVDQEVIENLELLENLDGAADLDLLEELSLER